MALALDRKEDESVIIGNKDFRMEIMVVSIRGDRVRLGFTAPREIRIERVERVSDRSSAGAATEVPRVE